MKPFSDQDHYEILEVSRDASEEEIERAFRMAQSTYGAESLAGYSVFGEGEAEAIRERIETAYRVLTHAESRAAYDAMLGVSDVDEASAERTEEPGSDAALAGDAAEALPPAGARSVDELVELEDEEPGEFDGGRLRRSRIDRGIELEEIAGWTKVNPTYLRFIEEDRYDELPAPVYVRGFVTAYAEFIGLDAKQVAKSYMKSLEAGTGRGRRGRFLSGR